MNETLSTILGGILGFILWIVYVIAFGIHLWSSVIINSQWGLIAAIFAFAAPVVSEIISISMIWHASQSLAHPFVYSCVGILIFYGILAIILWKLNDA